MLRFLTLLVLVAGICLAGTKSSVIEPSGARQSDIALLKELRIKLLEDRVSGVQSMVAVDRVSSAELIRPEIDVINAKIDYAESDAERKKLLGELLEKYDKLIEVAKFRATEPPPLASRDEQYGMNMNLEWLHLRSERIRIQIVRDSID